jgi:hypothetical protein
MVAAFGSARGTLSRAQRHCSRILQFQQQGTNIAFRYAIASHEKPQGGIPEQLVQRWLSATLVKHDFLSPQFRHGDQPAGG